MSDQTKSVDQTDAKAYVGIEARSRLADLRDLIAVAGFDEHELSDQRLSALEIDPTAAGWRQAELADETLTEYPLCIEATTRFEIVLGVGGPDSRLCLDCVDIEQHNPEKIAPDYEIRRVYFVYTWSGSAEIELTGDDRETAEAFGRRVVPELGE